ncbi:MAG: flagellar filament capping protein FliD [Verrucomicrobiae bacterium]|nr:flagellar filament capping protein FliD [Verrucomicrobiae bacterium]
MASSSGVNLAISGLASGFDWQSLVTQLAQAERSPETGWQTTQNKINSQNSSWTIIKSYLSQMQSSVQALKDSTIYNNRTAGSSVTTVASATSASGGMTGTFNFNISQLATATSLTGTGNISAPISATNDVSSLTVGAANFATAVTAGTFSVNGATVNIATTDSLKDVFDKIATATSNAVTASYNSTTDKITLSSASQITLGSAADTSNFLQVAKLYNNATGTITSNDTLGRVNTGEDLSNVGLTTAVSDGGSGAGQFNVNGVAISYNAGKDTVQNVLDRINNSTAGVTAAYDVVNNRFTLANKTTGDVGISLQDVSGNFLAATGLTSSISQGISADGNMSSVTVGAANFGPAVTAGNFSINGASVAIATSDSLQDVFDKIATATGNAVTASYDKTTDKITLSSASAITLGSATDTSNFLQAAKLFANGGGTVTSSDKLARVNTAATLNSTNLKTAVSDGGGAGAFTVNGATINFNAGTDTLQTVMDKINNSAAGVNASYDLVNNRFVLANKNGGDANIALKDVSGNLLAATGMSGAFGSFSSGKNLTYTVNGGPTLVSQSNTIDSTSSGISGLSVTALTNGATAITVGADTSAVQTDIQNFVNAYNNVQSYITTNAASTTDSTGKVTAGTLTGDVDAGNLASSLRTNIFSSASITGLSAGFSQLANLGITSNGYNNTVTLDSSALSDALTSNLGDIQKLFSDPTHGLGVQLDNFLTNTVGDSGTITNHQAALTKQSQSIDTQITNQEKLIATDSAFWTTEFQNMETAQAKINQELTTLNQQVSNGTL